MSKKYLPKYAPYVAEWEEWARQQPFYALFDECLIGWEGAASKYGKELSTLRAKLAEAERDAARYRYLRANCVQGRMESRGPNPDFALNCDEPESEWDAAIDAAVPSTSHDKERT